MADRPNPKKAIILNSKPQQSVLLALLPFINHQSEELDDLLRLVTLIAFLDRINRRAVGR